MSSEDVQLVADAFNELNDEEKIEFYILNEEIFKSFYRIEKNAKENESCRRRYKTDEEYRERMRFNNRNYYKRKKEKEKKLSQTIDAED
jgi:hypothetical protein